MDYQRVAIVGLGRVGSMFLQAMLERGDKGVRVVAAAETGATPGRAAAERAGVPLRTLGEIIDGASEIDIVFDLTGLPEVRQQLRQGLARTRNTHSVIAPESVARLLWSMISSEALPAVHAETGYGA